MSDTSAEPGERKPLQLPLYGALLGSKRVVPSARTGYVAVEQFLFFELMSRQLAHVPVDEEWYLERYPDIRDAIENGAATSARHHYARFGYFEHRMPWNIQVDEEWYLKAHPDIQDALDKKLYETAQAHYEMHGFREGRLPYPGFNLFDDKPAA